jgi:putative endonuclease
VYYELFFNIEDAIKREKQLKRYPRVWKCNLVMSKNPEWNDLSASIGITKEVIESAKGIVVPGINPGRQNPSAVSSI